MTTNHRVAVTYQDVAGVSRIRAFDMETDAAKYAADCAADTIVPARHIEFWDMVKRQELQPEEKPTSILEIFWMVWCEFTPTCKHKTEWLARNEARRLAEKNPGKTFFVLKATSYHQAHVTVRMESTNMETTQ